MRLLKATATFRHPKLAVKTGPFRLSDVAELVGHGDFNMNGD